MADDQLFQRFGKEFPPGTVLFRDGEPGREMYVVQAGHIQISKQVGEVEKLLATLGPGDYFGEVALIDDSGLGAVTLGGKTGTIRKGTFRGHWSTVDPAAPGLFQSTRCGVVPDNPMERYVKRIDRAERRKLFHPSNNRR